MTKKIQKETMPKFCWHKTLQVKVEVIRRGVYPDTVQVKLPDGALIEAYRNDLEGVG